MRLRLVRALLVCAALTGLLLHRGDAVGAISNGGTITALGVPLTENFDTLPSSGSATWANNATIPGWYQVRTGTGTTIVADAGSGTAGALYSYGPASNIDRALGSIGSGNAAAGSFYWGVRLSNGSGSTITSLTVSYVGEQWRNSAAAAQTVSFSYRIGANLGNALTDFTTLGTSVPQLDFTSPVTGGTAGALNGNLPANRVAISYTITGLSIANGQEILLRWSDPDHSGTDHGLAIDDFSVTANGSGPVDNPPTLDAAHTSPAANATNVPVTTTITVPFSEPVTAAAGAFSLACPAGSGRTFSVTPTLPSTSPVSAFTLTPSASLPTNTTCTVTVNGSSITDADGNPDHVAGTPSFSFTTVQPTDTAPFVASVTPANGTANVPVATPITVTFSENVTLGATPVSLVCASAPQSVAISGGPKTFTLTPSAPLPYGAACTLTVFAGQVSDTDGVDPINMLQDAQSSFGTPPAAAGKVIINEIDADTPGDDRAEFIELYDGGSGNTPLDGLVVVLFNGTIVNPDGTQSTSGKAAYAAFDLDGYTTDANGYFVLGNPGVAHASPIPFDPGQFGLLQNGPDAVGLYVGHASDFPAGTSATTANLVDAIVYGTDDGSASGLTPLLNTGQRIVNENATGDSQNQSSQRCANGAGGARNTSSYYPGAPSPGTANNCPAARPASPVVISQIYGGGGNSGATFRNDFVELYNYSGSTVDLTGWSVQYSPASSTGSSFLVQPIGGSIGAGEYYLVSLASGGSNGAPLPVDANILGDINMAAGSGKVALVNSFDALLGGCPAYDPHIMDLVGYGSADCSEGPKTAPVINSSTADFRKSGGAQDTDVNGDDFGPTATPAPRRTAAIVELGPLVLRTDPARNALSAPRDATIDVTFTEPVDVDGQWFDINCTTTGHHPDATFAGAGKDHYITPNVNFQAGEQCTVTVYANQVHDQDTNDSAPNTDTLPADYTWSFTVASGTAPPETADVHVRMGMPWPATADPGNANNYLMAKPEYTVSYNRDLGRPNWVSWHLSTDWIGTLARVDTFRPDPQVPPDWYRVQAFDFAGTGFDRGHMTPNADRDKETSIPINQATFLMSNMVAQAPDNNQGPWAAFEGYLRTLVDPGGDEIYIVAGPNGIGGSGSNGGTTTTLAGGNVTVPAWTWKVAMVLPKDDASDDVSRVTCSTRTIAVIMPNVQGIRNTDWHTYLKTVDDVETLTGYDFFSNVPEPLQQCIEARKDGDPELPLVPGNQTITFAPIGNRVYGDPDVTLSATASSHLPVTFSVSGPATLAGGALHLTGAGTVTVTASQAGSTIWNAAADVIQTVDVAKAAQLITFDAGGDRTYGDAPFAISATGGASGNPVTFAASGACSVQGTTVTIVSAGTCTLVASQAGDGNYEAAADVTRTLTVAKAGAAFSALTSPSIEAGAAATTIGGTLTAGATGSVTIAVGAVSVSAPLGADGRFSAAVASAAFSPASSPYAIAFSYAGDVNFTSAEGHATLTVTDSIPPSIALIGAADLYVEGGTPYSDPGATATDSFAGDLTSRIVVSGTVNTGVVGIYTQTYSVSDGYQTASASRTVHVVDTTAPAIAPVTANPATLGAPNHKMIDVTVGYAVSDVMSAPACGLSVSSNEAVNGLGDGNTAADWLVIDAHHVQLRAERAGGGSGRIYTVTVRCTDASGNAATRTTSVSVPK